MRNPDRLDEFYMVMLTYHKEHCPDMREGQFLYNFMYWMENIKMKDPFYIEHDEMMDMLQEYDRWNERWK